MSETELMEIISELLSIIVDEGHADNYQPQVRRARIALKVRPERNSNVIKAGGDD